MSVTKKNWLETNNRFVAFFDILGFKDMIMRRSHKDIYDLLEAINKINKNIEDDDEFKEFDDEDDDDTGIKVINFSDSIVFFSKTDSYEDLKNFTLLISLVFRRILQKKVLIKGAVAYGKVSLNEKNRIFFGQPIIDAFELQEQMNYLGIACHFTFDHHISSQGFDLKNSTVLKRRLRQLVTPLKSGNIVHTNLIWFTDIYSSTKKGIDSLEILESMYDKVSGAPRAYLDKTIKLINDIKKPE